MDNPKGTLCVLTCPSEQLMKAVGRPITGSEAGLHVLSYFPASGPVTMPDVIASFRLHFSYNFSKPTSHD